MIINHCRLVAALSGGVAAEDGFVEVQDGKITAVSAVPAADGTADFDAQGRTLLPGLIEAHTHVGMSRSAANDMDQLSQAIKKVKRYLDYGFTTVRDCGSIHGAALYLRGLIRDGAVEGPSLIACGHILYPSVMAAPGIERYGVRMSDGVDEYLKHAREEAAAGADFLKIYASGSAALPTGVPKHPIMLDEEIGIVVKTANMNGMYVSAHCHADEAIRSCVKAGVKTIEHATYLSEDTIRMIADTPDCFLIPTLSPLYVSEDDEERDFWEKRMEPMRRASFPAFAKAFEAGLKMGFGTDLSPGSEQYEKGVEFRFRRDECGIPDLEILKQATVHNAEILGMAEHAGTVEKGKNADLVLFDGKPDCDIMEMAKKPRAVWKRGRLVRQRLD